MKYVVVFILLIAMILSVSAFDIPLDGRSSSTNSLSGFGDFIRTVIAQNVILSDRNDLLKEQNKLLEEQNKILFIQTCYPMPDSGQIKRVCGAMGLYEKYNRSQWD